MPRNLKEFDAMFQELNNWGRWGPDDEIGTTNLITPEKIREAAKLVRSGITVSLAHNPMPNETPDNPDTAFNHIMSSNLGRTVPRTKNSNLHRRCRCLGAAS